MSKELSNTIKLKAKELGFSLSGICRAEAMINEGEKLKSWIGKGYNAGMKWFERTIDHRIDPSMVLEGVKSILIFGLNYYQDIQRNNSVTYPKVSKYALGKDYHKVMNEKLTGMSLFLKSIVPDIKVLCYSDTGPLMEKVLAQKSGLGWIGKNTNLINRREGSFFFLGCILTDLELVYDKTESDHCGSCSRCIDACPTNAIVEPYVLDSNKCISYLTIEYRGDELPKELNNKFDGWIFGCDICQDVCPWNRFSKQTSEPAFIYSPEFEINPEELSKLTEDEFKEKFQYSPIKRAKHKGLMRNLKFVSRD